MVFSPHSGVRCIAHRGASHHILDNTLGAFELAHKLGAAMWELDVHLSADGVPFVSHDDHLTGAGGVERRITKSKAADLDALRFKDGQRVPRLQDVIDLAAKTGSGLYVEIKDPAAAPKSLTLLHQAGLKDVVIGSFDHQVLQKLRKAGCPFALSVLVGAGKDPMAAAILTGADMIHLCWEKTGPRPQDLVTPDILSSAINAGLEIVLWHSEDPAMLREMMALPVFGICTNRPELMVRRPPDKPGMVCHRGANRIVPENTIEGAAIAFGLGAAYVELDIRQTTDGQLVVMHDATLDRTTNMAGKVADRSWAELSNVRIPWNIGSGQIQLPIPYLGDFLACAEFHGGGLYVEIKDADPVRVIEAVLDAGLIDECFFWSGNPAIRKAVKLIDARARLMVCRKHLRDISEALDPWKADIVEFDVSEMTPDDLAFCRANNLSVMAGVFGDLDEDIAEALARGCDLINFDRPDLISARIS